MQIKIARSPCKIKQAAWSAESASDLVKFGFGVLLNWYIGQREVSWKIVCSSLTEVKQNQRNTEATVNIQLQIDSGPQISDNQLGVDNTMSK